MLSFEKSAAVMMSDHEKRLQGTCPANSLSYQETLARRNMYRFLASTFLNPPDQASLECITERDFLANLSMLFSEKAVGGLKEFASPLHIVSDLASLTQEYMDLFAVPAGRYVAPFEDVYGEMSADRKQERGPLLGRRAISVITIYREAGAEMEGTCRELPTHIGVELSFMSFLCEREALAICRAIEVHAQEESAAMRYRELQMRFLQEHLNKWFPHLCQSIQANATSQFYKSLALITEEFLAQDTASLLAQIDSV